VGTPLPIRGRKPQKRSLGVAYLTTHEVRKTKEKGHRTLGEVKFPGPLGAEFDLRSGGREYGGRWLKRPRRPGKKWGNFLRGIRGRDLTNKTPRKRKAKQKRRGGGPARGKARGNGV